MFEEQKEQTESMTLMSISRDLENFNTPAKTTLKRDLRSDSPWFCRYYDQGCDYDCVAYLANVN